MSERKSLMMRAEARMDEVERKIRKYHGRQVIGTIGELKRELDFGSSNNELRMTLSLLCKAGRITGTPLEATAGTMKVKQYLYLAPIKIREELLDLLADGRIDRSGTAADYVEMLEWTGLVDPDTVDGVLKLMISDREIKAPVAVLANNASKLERDVYLYLERVS